MIELIETHVQPGVLLLAGWSVRWAFLIVVLGAGLAVWRPRRAATHMLLCQLVLVGGLLLPLLPHYWGPALAPESTINADTESPRPARLPAAASLPVNPALSAAPELATKSSGPTALRSPVPSVQVEEAPPADVGGPPTPESAVTRPAAQRPILTCVLLALATSWLIGVVLLGGRLILNWWGLVRVRESAQPASATALELFHRCRSEMCLRRSAALLTHPAVRAPVILVGMRPAILLPLNWDDLPEENRRAALVHELSHLARRDDWAKAGEEIVRVLFFFHPLVRWLLGRLECERERQSDAAVVRHGMEPRKLARVLLDFAKLVGPGQPALRLGKALPFFNRITVKDRIHQLLEDDMTHWIRPLARGHRAAITAAALGLIAGLGSFGLMAGAAQEAPKATTQTPVEAKQRPALSGVVQDEAGRPLPGATVILQRLRGRNQPLLAQSEADGIFKFASLPSDPPNGYALIVVAAKEGFAPSKGHPNNDDTAITLKLAKAAAVHGVVKDGEGKPVAGARVQIGTVQRFGSAAVWGYVSEEVLRGTPLEKFFFTATDAQGKFRFTTAPAGSELIFRAEADGFAEVNTAGSSPKGQHFAKPDAPRVEMVLTPEARLNGSVVSRVSGTKVEGLRVWLEPINPHQSNFFKQAQINAAGQFSLGGLPEGSFSVLLSEAPVDAGWVARAAPTVSLRAAETAAVEIELIEGALVEGSVVVADTEKPLAGVRVLVHSLTRPKTINSSFKADTDREGRYRLRLPPGEAEFEVRTTPAGYTALGRSEGLQKTVIAEGRKAVAGPKLTVVSAGALAGVLVDARGKSVAQAEIIGLCRGAVCTRVGGQKVTTDVLGRFRIETGPEGPFPLGEITSLEVALAGGKIFEVRVVVVNGSVEARLPTIVDGGLADIKGPDNVQPGELAGIVVDANGQPLEGVHVHVWDWADRPENQARTGKDGVFRIKDCGRDRKVQVRFRKPDYSPVMFVQQPAGVKGLVVVMDSKTYFEGTVYAPDDKPAANAVIRADQGTKMADGVLITHVWTDTKADASGRYRLYVEPDGYEFLVKAPGVGVARLAKTPITHGQTRKLDIHLNPGVTFRAQVTDAGTGKPVAGARLSNWEHKDVEGRSDATGQVVLGEMLPGRFDFQVEAAGYARWWSPDAVSEWNRAESERRPGTGFQRNFDGVDFDMKPGMAPVNIVLEQGVRITGRVLDADGKPVAGATAAPALTGTGNSLTGDTRFSVETKKDGTFEMLLPASGKAQYNLVAHDGKYGQWRQWANGVLPPFMTTPGQEIKDVVLTLTKPASVRGKVVDARGNPVAFREVRAHAADKLENRYYDPTTTTKQDGTFQLRFIRPGEHFIKAAPFWMTADDAPANSTRRLRLTAGETVERIELVGNDPAQ